MRLDIYAEDSTFFMQTPISVLYSLIFVVGCNIVTADAHTLPGCFAGFNGYIRNV